MIVGLSAYIPIGWSLILAFSLCGFFFVLIRYCGPRSSMSQEKLGTFECGSDPIGSPHNQLGTGFYRVAVLFLLFDIEAAFMFPWAVNYADLSKTSTGDVSWFGFVEMAVFVFIFMVALVYVWRKKVLRWV